jgi:prephenate dehydratase
MGLLGPDGTFTTQIGYEYQKKQNIKPEIILYKTIEDCFDAVDKKEVEIAIVPILNSTSTAAWVNQTLGRLRNNGAMIYGEQVLKIRHNLAVVPGTKKENIRYIHSKDKALQQCTKYLSKYDIELVNATSTAAAAQDILSLEDSIYRAAVVPQRAVDLYGLEILEKDIQDDPNNKTKFIVISNKDHKPTGNDKTTAMFEFKDVENASLLYNVLKEFAKRGISLGYIQSIPKASLDEFTFYMDIIGHRKDKEVDEALKAIEANKDLSFWRVLGSYPIF